MRTELYAALAAVERPGLAEAALALADILDESSTWRRSPRLHVS